MILLISKLLELYSLDKFIQSIDSSCGRWYLLHLIFVRIRTIQEKIFSCKVIVLQIMNNKYDRYLLYFSINLK